jgi:putative hemolysin
MDWKLFLLLTLLCIVFQGYFAMMEMAIVSYNKVRLQYHLSQGSKKAYWLTNLLNKPTYLFGTTLIGVNLFLQLGSECSRSFYMHLGIDPDYAFISQIIVVVLFAELTPLFAARTYPEHVVRLGITPIYFLSKALIPFIWILDGICRLIDWILRCPPPSQNYLTREELQKAIEGKDVKDSSNDQEHLDSLVQAIFVIKTKTPPELMMPIEKVPVASSDSTVKEIEYILNNKYVPYIPLYYKKPQNIFGILYARDLLKLNENDYVRDVARSPWFITEKNSLFQILKQFRWNNQHIAVVLDDNGNASGILTLDSLIEDIFEIDQEAGAIQGPIIVDRAFPAHTLVTTVNRQLGISLPTDESETLEDLMALFLGHEPSKLETVRIKNFEFTLESSPLLADKSIKIRTL